MALRCYLAEDIEELRERYGCRPGILDGAGTVARERSDGKRHGDAVIAERVAGAGAELLPAWDHHAIRRLFPLDARAPKFFGDRGDRVGFLASQFARLADGEALLAGCAERRQYGDFINQSGREIALDDAS